jgi:hypothetical protein
VFRDALAEAATAGGNEAVRGGVFDHWRVKFVLAPAT